MTEEYSNYLLSDAWKEKRNSKLSHAGRRCEVCGIKKRLQIHHLTYERIFNEEMDDLMVLCKRHHKEVEALYKEGSLTKKGDVSELRERTLAVMQLRQPVPVPVVDEFWGITATTPRPEMVAILLGRPEYREMLPKPRREACKKFGTLSKMANGIQGKIYAYMTMTYDAYHGNGSYRKFRQEVLEIANKTTRPICEEVECVAVPKPTRPVLAPRRVCRGSRKRIPVDTVDKWVWNISRRMESNEVRVFDEDKTRLLAMLSSWVGSLGVDVADFDLPL